MRRLRSIATELRRSTVTFAITALITLPLAPMAIKQAVLDPTFHPKPATPYIMVFMLYGVVFQVVNLMFIIAKRMLPARTFGRSDFPKAFVALGMLWPTRVRLEIWDPSFNDELALYHELRQRSRLWNLNVCFAFKMIPLVLGILLITLTDWRLLFTRNRRSR